MSRSIEFRSLCTAVVTLAVSMPAWAGVWRHDRPESWHLDVNDSIGIKDTSAKATWSVPGIGSYLGSGTFIEEDWLVTAAHVAWDFMSDQASSVTITTADGLNYSVENAYVHPNAAQYVSGDDVYDLNWANDIALFELSQNASGISTAPRVYGSNEVGYTGWGTGYGKSGTGATGSTGGAGTYRVTANKIDDTAGYDDRVLLMDFDNPNLSGDSSMGTSSPMHRESLIAPGDSGGGLFIEVNNTMRLAGVHVFGRSTDGLTNSDYGDVSGHVRISKHNTWIDSILAGTGSSFSITPGTTPDLITSTETSMLAPEPASLACFALGAGLIALRRRP